MFCHNCGNEVKEDAVFCSHCGARQNAGKEAGTEKETKTEMNAAGTPEEARTEGIPSGNAPSGGASEKPEKKKKGKGGIIALIIGLVLAIGAGVGCALYFTGDAYVSRKNMKLAEECFDAEEYEEALEYYEKALKLDSGLAQAYIRSADIYLLEEKYGEAIEILEKGLKKTREDEDSQEEIEEKIEEITRLENGAAAAKLQEYLENELEPRYGYADLSAKKQFFDWNTSFEQNRNWTGMLGMANAEIRDLDGDGRDEMLVIVLEEKITLSIYEVEENVPVKKAEHSEERCSDMIGYDVIYAMVDGGGIPYLFMKEEMSGILSDGYMANVKLYRYDGTNIYMPLGILQTGGGSSDFEFKAYEYDAGGNLLCEETVYDEVYDHEVNYDSAHCYGRVADLFGKYGLELDSGAAINGEKKLFDDLAASQGYRELLYLRMWGVNQSDGAVYYFNDWDSPILVYESFLRGEKTVRARAGAWFDDQEQMDLTLQDMLEQIGYVYLEYSEKDTVSRIEYAYLDCGGDGVEELAVKFVGLDIYYPDDDSDVTVVISCENGELELIYSRESWARSGTTINYYGCIYTGGSDGAGAYYEELEYINAEHVVQTICEVENLGGWWVSYVSDEAYQQVFGNGGTEPNMELRVYDINGSAYHVADLDEDSGQECWDYIALCQAEGKVFVQEEEAENLLRQRVGELGVKEEWLSDNELYWRWLWY